MLVHEKIAMPKRSIALGQGLRPADGREAAVGRDEAVEIARAGLEAGDGDLDRIIAPRAGDRLAAGDDPREIGGFGNLP
jgi:hypothetical protein